MDELEELEKQGYRLVDIIAGDVKPTKEIQYLVDKAVEKKGNSFYSGLLYNFTPEKFPEEKARALWQEILRHKYVISERLGRNIGIRVAALDYLENLKKIIKSPMIIPETEFAKTLKLSTTDSLTGLFNRRVILDELSETVREHKMKNMNFCLLMTDLDGFKKLNDTQGHQIGDLILQEVAQILRESTRENDMMGRYGGDEIICVLPATGKDEAKRIAARIRQQMEKELKEVKITLSIGMVEYPSDAGTDEELISLADEALYRAKLFGGNAVSYFHNIILTYQQNDPQPKEVSCVGDFNRWNSKKGNMKFDAGIHQWKISLNLLAGKYKYKFLIDGQKWIADPEVVECGDDGFGGMCSILRVNIE
jgi:diguanylate cyclase (GGDEF)-like protein